MAEDEYLRLNEFDRTRKVRTPKNDSFAVGECVWSRTTVQVCETEVPDGTARADFAKDFECIVCRSTLSEAKGVMECLHRFCEACIEESLVTMKWEICPSHVY